MLSYVLYVQVKLTPVRVCMETKANAGRNPQEVQLVLLDPLFHYRENKFQQENHHTGRKHCVYVQMHCLQSLKSQFRKVFNLHSFSQPAEGDSSRYKTNIYEKMTLIIEYTSLKSSSLNQQLKRFEYHDGQSVIHGPCQRLRPSPSGLIKLRM